MLTVKKLSLNSITSPLFLLIFSASFLSTLLEQGITNKVEQLISSQDGLSNMIFVYAGISLLGAMLFPVLTSLVSSFILVQNENPKSLGQFISDNGEMTLLESIRAWGKSFLWSFAFLLPGVWKFIAYTLTPYVVMFSKKYKNGEVDALEYSEKICKKYLKRVNGWLTVFYLVVPILVLVIADDYRLFSKTPVAATILVVIRAVCEFLFHYTMLKIFFDFIKTDEADSAIAEPAV